MDDTSKNKPKKHICAALLAHVDAGKTTLSECMLYLSGSIRKQGRVDHKDTFLDTYELERSRGITIFSKQAEYKWKDMDITLLDTPGHVDFAAEMERTLQVLDYAILVVSGADGVQGHTETLWRLLKQYEIPAFIFVNKMDQKGTNRGDLLLDIKKQLDENCVEFGGNVQNTEAWYEELAMCGESLLEQYLETGSVCVSNIQKAIAGRRIFPCYFGSALKGEGVTQLLDGLNRYAKRQEYSDKFGAKVYKIARDEQGRRLTYLKVTGGTLRVRDTMPGMEEKVNEIRIYSGAKYETLQAVQAGMVCAVTGLSQTYPGQGIGTEKASDMFILEPVLNYRVLLPPDCDVHRMLLLLRQLEEEEPQLHVVWQERLSEIHVQLMGEVQTEVLRSMILQRFGEHVMFDEGNIVYKETIENTVEGVGHFEPLRHYAEVHLLLEPAERGSGLQFATDLSEDVLGVNWQRLVITHLEEKVHKGVLTGSAITDMKITLVAGRAHLKHTEGGDFRQATYRAVRQGLRKADSVLLEPYYELTMELPAENVGRAMTDIQNMAGKFDPPQMHGEGAVLTGTAPVAKMGGYQKDFLSYTGGRGRFSCRLKGYERCHNQDEIVAKIGYDPDADTENPTGSVFCAHGAGFVVNWNQVESYMQVESPFKARDKEDMPPPQTARPLYPSQTASGSRIELTEAELDAIYRKTPDPVKRSIRSTPITIRAAESRPSNGKWDEKRKKHQGEEYLLVDGYNIIFAWDELKQLAEINIEAARNKLMDVLCNYQGYKKCTVILVYDAYKVEGSQGEIVQYHNIHVVYTKEAETADQYIEKTVTRIGRQYNVTVATSDALEQVIIMGRGAQRLSAEGLKEEVEQMILEIRQEYLAGQKGLNNYLFDYMSEELAEKMETLRRGRNVVE